MNISTSQAVEAAEREKFEAHLTANVSGLGTFLEATAKHDNGDYVSKFSHQHWLTWKARAELASQQGAAPVGPIFEVYGTDAEGLDHVLEVRSVHDFCGSVRIHAHLPATRSPVAAEQGRGEGVVPEGFALVPLRMTQEMHDVTDEEGWQWEDVLAAAGTITPEQYDVATQAPSAAVPVEVESDKGQALKTYCDWVGLIPGQRDIGFFDAGYMARKYPATPPGGAGGSVGASREQDSFHVVNAESSRVQGVELALFRQTIEGFADCGETETDYATLLNWAQRGLLECTNFRPTTLAHRILDAAQKGGAV